MTEEIPTWLIRHLEEELPEETHFLNARTLKRGQYLVNTSHGAVYVRKSSLGEPQASFLPVSEWRLDLTCRVCNERMALVDPDLPRDVYCINCGTPWLIDGDGTMLRSGEPAAVMPPQHVEAPVVRFNQGTASQTTGPADEAPAPGGPYKHGDYTLHERKVKLATGGTQTIYFFAKKKPKSGTPCAMPDGYEVGVNQATGLPFLRKTGGHKKDRSFEPQCQAVTAAGDQCKNSARHGSKYCGSHKGYRPPAKAEIRSAKDTLPRVRKAKDTAPAARKGRVAADKKYRPQCQALTPAGSQCKNSARDSSKYCGSHKGYRPPAKAVASKGKDTKPRVKKAKDTAPSARAA